MAQHKTSNLVLAAASLILCLSSRLVIAAETNRWMNPLGGNWDTGSNWSLGVAPDADDDVVIDLDQTYTITISDVEPVRLVQSLTLGSASGTHLQTLSIIAGALTVSGASTVGASGVLSLGSPGSQTFQLFRNNGGLQVDGVLSLISAFAELEDNADLTIKGKFKWGGG